MVNAPPVSTPERNRIAAVLAAMPDFTDYEVRGRRVLLKAAGLGRFLAMNLGGSPPLVAQDLVDQLADHGPLEESPVYHALGALLSYLLEKKEIPYDDRHFLAQVLTKYALVRDPDYLAQKRGEYNLPEPAAPAATAPLPPDGPDFQPALADIPGLERVLHSEDNFLDIYLLAGAIYSAQAVCLIEYPKDTPRGTGFLIGPDLLLTNQHVLKSQEYVRGAVIKFDYRIDALGVKQESRPFTLDPAFYYASPEADLDYALVRVTDRPLKHLAGDGPPAQLPPST